MLIGIPRVSVGLFQILSFSLSDDAVDYKGRQSQSQNDEEDYSHQTEILFRRLAKKEYQGKEGSGA